VEPYKNQSMFDMLKIIPRRGIRPCQFLEKKDI